MAKYLKPILFSFLLLGALELIARLVPYSTRIEIQQDYASAHPDHSYKPRNNGRGARGVWPDERRFSIALFGSSIAEQRVLAWDQSWPGLLEKKFGGRIRIDNFGAGSIKVRAIESLIDDLVRRGIHYDAVILQSTIYRDDDIYPLEHLYSGSYYKKYTVPPHRLCHFCFFVRQTLGQWLEVSYGKENVRRLEKKLWPSLPQAESKARFRYNAEERNRLRSEGRLVRHVPEIREYDIRRIHEITAGLIPKLRTITDRVLWIPEIVYYDPRMKPSYFERYVTLIPQKIPDPDPDPKYYLDEESIFQQMFKRSRVMAPLMEAAGIPEIRWHEEYGARMRNEEGLNLDEYHLTAKGAAAFADIIYPQLKPILDPLIDQKAK